MQQITKIPPISPVQLSLPGQRLPHFSTRLCRYFEWCAAGADVTDTPRKLRTQNKSILRLNCARPLRKWRWNRWQNVWHFVWRLAAQKTSGSTPLTRSCQRRVGRAGVVNGRHPSDEKKVSYSNDYHREYFGDFILFGSHQRSCRCRFACSHLKILTLVKNFRFLPGL